DLCVSRLHPLSGHNHWHWRRRRIASTLGNRDDPDDPQAERARIKTGARTTRRDRLGSRFVERRFRMLNRKIWAADLVRALGDERIEDLAGAGDVAEA